MLRNHFTSCMSAFVALLALTIFSGCGTQTAATTSRSAVSDTPNENVPTFSLAWSEYPSWSAFGVASEAGLINGKKGELGAIEKKWGIDIELKEADYDPCLTMYAAGQCDAVCMTNMDALNPSLSVPSVAILPTSTSYGADALIVTRDITSVKQLKGKKVFGLAKTCSEYCFVRNLENLGENPAEYIFTNMDPAAAALGMQQKQTGFDAIVVWNPFVLETLNKRPDTRVLFDSTKIPNEIIDMVVMSQSSLEKTGGRKFACAVIDTFYALNKRLADPATRDRTLIALGEKFSHLDLANMSKAVEQTHFYAKPEDGLKVLKSDDTKQIMRKVSKFCVEHQIVTREPIIGYGTKNDTAAANFRLDPSFIEAVQNAK